MNRLAAAVMVGLWLASITGSAQSVQAPKPRPIDAKVVATYERLGGTHAVLVIDRYGSMLLHDDPPEGTTRVPGFWFRKAPKEAGARLPQVEVPFGLDFN